MGEQRSGAATEPCIKVGTVELKDAQLAESMVRALGRQPEAERN